MDAKNDHLKFLLTLPFETGRTDQAFSASALWTDQAKNYSLEDVLCIVECLAASLASIHYITVHTPTH